MSNKVEKFEDLIVWQEAMDLVEKVYGLLSGCRDYGFKDQIQRAAVSVRSNIAEGFDRQTSKEFVQYLYIAKGSVSEVRTQLYLATRLHYVDEPTAQPLLEQTRKLSSMLFKLIQTRIDKF